MDSSVRNRLKLACLATLLAGQARAIQIYINDPTGVTTGGTGAATKRITGVNFWLPDEQAVYSDFPADPAPGATEPLFTLAASVTAVCLVKRRGLPIQKWLEKSQKLQYSEIDRLYHSSTSGGNPLRLLLSISFLLLIAGYPAAGIPIYINDPDGITNGTYVGTSRFEGRYKVDNNNWDLGLGPVVGSGQFKSADVGNTGVMLPPVWEFELTSDPSAGITWHVRNNSVPGSPWITTTWGLNEELNTFTPFERAFNTIRIQVRGTGNANQNRTAVLTDLNFRFVGNQTSFDDRSGLTDMSINRLTPASQLSNFPADAAGGDSHWIYTSGDFATVAWQIRGLIDFGSSSGNPSESLKIGIITSQYTYTQFPADPESPVPESGTWVMVAAGLVLVIAGRGVYRREPRR